jgi:glucuronate isomerase
MAAAPVFMDDNFLLETETARTLYHGTAKKEPIFDYHCHLVPSQIAENRKFSDLTEVWLEADHYKWRMMRAMGIDEQYITGDAKPYDKFLAWARTVENLIGNPLYHWTHLELQRCFEITEPLTEKSAPRIWKQANELLQTADLTVKGIFKNFNVDTVGTTDDPVDSLEYHKAIADGTAAIKKIKTAVIPSFRPDMALDLNASGFSLYIETLSKASGVTIKSFDDVFAALEKRLDFFISRGCKASDHGLSHVPFELASKNKIEKAFNRAMLKKHVSKDAAEAYKTAMLVALSGLYAKRGIVMQLHMSVIRNVSKRSFIRLGANTGYDAVNDRALCENLSSLLNLMESESPRGLPKTILYSLNPKDYYPLATIMGGFQGNTPKDKNTAGANAEYVSKMQLGSAWWFCDHKDGMEEQMRTLANLGRLSSFVGMLTDSRSFLSYPRHEYFRRILCNLIGGWVENGEYPIDEKKLTRIIRDISFENAKNYF